MNIDIEDVFAGVFGSLMRRLLLFFSAIWLGSTVGAVALVAGEMIEAGGWYFDHSLVEIWLTPFWAFHGWGLWNVPILLFTFVYFIRGENVGYRAWGIFAGVEALAVMVAWAQEAVSGWLPLLGSWVVWVMLVVMLETGVWLLYQAGMNRWAQEIGLLRARNQQRRELEERQGIEPFPEVNEGS